MMIKFLVIIVVCLSGLCLNSSAQARSIEPIPLYENVENIGLSLHLLWRDDTNARYRDAGVKPLELRDQFTKEAHSLMKKLIKSEYDLNIYSLYDKEFSEVNPISTLMVTVYIDLYNLNISEGKYVAVLDVVLSRSNYSGEPRTQFNVSVPFLVTTSSEQFKNELKKTLEPRFKQIVWKLVCDHSEKKEKFEFCIPKE